MILPLAASRVEVNLPVMSGSPDWVMVMLILIAGLFLAAAVIGPIVRMNDTDESTGESHG